MAPMLASSVTNSRARRASSGVGTWFFNFSFNSSSLLSMLPTLFLFRSLIFNLTPWGSAPRLFISSFDMLTSPSKPEDAPPTFGTHTPGCPYVCGLLLSIDQEVKLGSILKRAGECRRRGRNTMLRRSCFEAHQKLPSHLPPQGVKGENSPWDPATPEAQLIADRVGFLEAIRETVCGFRTISSPYSTPLLIVKNANSRTGRGYKPRSDLLTPYAGYKRCELHTLLLD